MVGPVLPMDRLAQASSAGAVPESPPIAGYVSEAMEMLYGAGPGTILELPLAGSRHPNAEQAPPFLRVMVMGVWRDYARQFGAVAIDIEDYQRHTGDRRINDLALQLQPGTDATLIQQALRGLAPEASLIEFAVPSEIRTISMRIFDRSFAVTYYLQALAIGIGLFGIAASFSAQVLARRKEFGLLQHLGLTRRQILAVVAGEGAAWTAGGALAGVALGLMVSAVLVHVVNPQSFHWTMELIVPWMRLALLAGAVLLAGSATAALAARSAASSDAVQAVREDW
jgi:putative ABC transport system permease protein